MNSNIILQLNIMAISLATLAFVFLVLMIFLILILFSIKKHYKKLDDVLGQLNDIAQNINNISSIASDEADRIRMSLDNIHGVVDDVGSISKRFTKNMKNIGGIKDILNILFSAIVSIFQKK